MKQLVFITPGFKDQSFKLPEGKTTVGRTPPNGLIIQDDSVSGHHCDILVYGTEVIIRDKASTNGTWVDGRRVKGQTSMSHGQYLRLGKVEARLLFPRPMPTRQQDTEPTAIRVQARLMRQRSRTPPPPDLPTIIRPRSSSEAAISEQPAVSQS